MYDLVQLRRGRITRMTTMDRSARAWLVTVAADHYWRVAHWYEFEDLLQDGHMVWWRIVFKYETEPERIRTRGHLMRLFKTAFLNHIHDLAKNKTVTHVEVRAEDVKPEVEGQEHDVWAKLGCSHDAGEYLRLIAEAPSIIQPLLNAILYGPPSRMLRSLYRVNRDGTRDTTNSKLCRLVGVDPESTDLATELRSYLKL